MMNIPNDYYAFNLASVNKVASCVLDGNKLKFQIKFYYSGTTSGTCAIKTSASKIYLLGVLAHD